MNIPGNRVNLYAIAMVSLLAAGLGGCAFTVHDVNVNYSYEKPAKADLSSSTETLRIAPFTDTRGNPNPRMLMNAQNMHGSTTTGGWQAEKPVADIVRDGFVQALTAAHAHIVAESDSMVLTGELVDYHYTVIQEFWKGTAVTKMIVKLRLNSEKSGVTLWNDTLSATINYRAASSPGEDVLFKLTLDNLMDQLTDSDLFKVLGSH
jgi:hypothetical protein